MTERPKRRPRGGEPMSKAELAILEKETGGKYQTLPDKTALFSQGDPSDTLFYITQGKVQVSVVSKQGRGGMIGVLSKGAFVGEASLTQQPLHLDTARAYSDCTILRISAKRMRTALEKNALLAEYFMHFLLRHSIEIQADLVDHLFNSSEKRLARVLLMLANISNTGKLETIPHITQELLAERVGTTRARISFFMNKFRRLGLIEYNGVIKVHSGLLNVVLADSRLTEKD